MRIEIDEDNCIGNGNCVRIAPEVFDQRIGDGVVRLLTSRPDPSLFVAMREAEASCPGQAIRAIEEDGD